MMIGMMVSGFLFLFVVMIAIGLAGHAIWRAIMPPPGLPRNAGCGSCGYELATLTHGRCSECGADLLKAGVTTRRNAVRTAGSLPAALLGWTAIVLTVGTILMYAVSIVSLTRTGVMSGNMNYTSNYTFRPIAPAGQTAPDFRLRVDIDVFGSYGMAANSGQISMELAGPVTKPVILFPDATTDEWIITHEDGTEIARGRGIRASDLLPAFAAAGLDPAQHPLVADFADRIEDLAVSALANPFTYETSISIHFTNQPPGTPHLLQSGGGSNFGGSAINPFGTTSALDYIVPLGILGVGLVVWAVGMFFIIRRRARLIEGPRDLVTSANIPPPPSPA